MRNKLFSLLIFLFIFSFPGQVLASTAKSVVETQVEAGEAQIYQSVETTVDGQTVRKESTQPGKLELEMKKTNGNVEVVTSPPVSFVSQIIEFFQNLFSQLTNWFK
jgi:hypothetical protein